jgi:hypothetical protein
MKFLNDIAGSGLNIFGAGGGQNIKQLEDLGLLKAGAKEKAQSQSLMRGLLGSVISYAAQPKNQGFGSGIPYIAKGLQQGMVEAQKPFDSLNTTAMQNQKIQAYKDEKTAKDNYAEFSKGMGLREHNMTKDVYVPGKLNSNLIDQDGIQIAPSMMDSSYKPEGTIEQRGFFDTKTYLDKKLAEGKITLEQYNANLPEGADYMAVGDRVFNKTSGEYVDGAGMSVGEEAVDKAYAADHIKWEQQGRGNYAKMEFELNDALNALENEENITGKLVGSVLNTTGGELTYPRAKAVQDYVLTTVQKSLRETLGAQFTEIEGKMLMDRAYNPLLSQAENAKRVRRLLGEIKSAKQSKEAMARYWKENNGSLVGYTGPSVRSAFGLPDTPDESVPNINDSTGGTTFNPDEFELIED